LKVQDFLYFSVRRTVDTYYGSRSARTAQTSQVGKQAIALAKICLRGTAVCAAINLYHPWPMALFTTRTHLELNDSRAKKHIGTMDYCSKVLLSLLLLLLARLLLVVVIIDGSFDPSMNHYCQSEDRRLV
jgi:hypothetical protein